MTVSGAEHHVRRSGKGAAVLVLPHDIGTLDRLPFYDALAASHDVIVPDYAGWGRSPRQSWMRSVRDMAVQMRDCWTSSASERVTPVGLGFGGWVAAELATMSPRSVDKLVVVGAVRHQAGRGLHPRSGDHLLYRLSRRRSSTTRPRSTKHYGEVSADQLEAWDIAREMCFRLAWKPYMYSQTLPHLLGVVKRAGAGRVGRRRQGGTADRRRTSG